ncbi:MAG: FkbM family methyltransferase [Solirubrobacteraceae bacterium]
MSTRTTLAGLRRRFWERQLPKVFNVTTLDPGGIKFEATNINERQRVVNCGDEPEYIREMLATLKPDDVLYDIGANVGLVALHAARKCRTVAFEPDPSFLSRLHRNLELNPTVSVQVLQIAVSDREGWVALFTDGVGGNSPSLVHQRGAKNSVDVRARTLDALVEGGTLPKPTVLKLDIEGAEILALRGAEHLLGGPAPPRALFLEVHDSFLPAFGSSADEVLGIVRGAGYVTIRYAAERAGQQHLILERR